MSLGAPDKGSCQPLILEPPLTRGGGPLAVEG